MDFIFELLEQVGRLVESIPTGQENPVLVFALAAGLFALLLGWSLNKGT